MSVLINSDDLQSDLTDLLQEYKSLFEEDPEFLREIFKKLIMERELFIDEIDEMREDNIIHHYYNSRINSERMKLLVDGLSTDTVNSLSLLSLKLNLSKGKILNHLMSAIISDENNEMQLSSGVLSDIVKTKSPRFNVSNLSRLIVNTDDLLEVDGKINFINIDFLFFGDDVSPELFAKKIGYIGHCGQLSLPPVIPKILCYAKIRETNSIEFR